MKSNSVKEDTIRAVLGAVFRLYVQSHCYHWNVEGPNFRSLHAMFETQYQTLNGFIDAIAERLRVLGVKAPASLDELLALSKATQDSTAQTTDEMLANHCADFQGLIDVLRNAIQVLADVRDDGTVGILSDILEWCEKEFWMMSATMK
ncbi:DNA starvation/stationary phase protection protein [Roseobacter sp. YSTF-M11]|uniref:DNA starvation/stationary phase protection protein n=1 Tax=Roseobacter insulae TaxID=2859783 RepID=A0A9X1FY44_9RHOB|nr:DNA starvation/stationary phase protection protein [Roseobacter insulae]MBW4709758.1 DNA starvation/stationary phase protection protein [Roseobacter insulae]